MIITEFCPHKLLYLCKLNTLTSTNFSWIKHFKHCEPTTGDNSTIQPSILIIISLLACLIRVLIILFLDTKWRIVLVTNTMNNIIEPLLKLSILVNWKSVTNLKNDNNYVDVSTQFNDEVKWGKVLHRNIYNALKVCF